MNQQTPEQIAQNVSRQALAEREKRLRTGAWTGNAKPHTAYQARPVDWLVDVLGYRREDLIWSLRPEYLGYVWNGTPDPLATALNALAAGRWTGIESGSGTGKTHLAAGITLWFLACWENARVFSVAPREDQLELNLWKEITKLFPKFKKHFPTAELGKLTLRVRGGIDDTWSAHGITARVGSDEDVAGRMRGFHEAHQLFIVEEGPGVDDAIWETIESTSGGSHNLVLGLGNPDSVHDPLHRFCIKSRVNDVRISCFDHPNVVCNNADVIPGATSRAWIADRAEKWGEGTNRYLRFVNGIAPEQSDDALILLEWCEAAATRWGDLSLRKGPRALGVDVADSPTGDESAISRWQGACCTEVVSFRAEDASAVGRKVYQEIKNADAPINPKHVGIDSVGVGVSTINELKRLDVRVRHISGGSRAGPFADIEAAPEPAEEGEKKRRNMVVEIAQYDNLRSQVYWRLREDLRLQRIALPPDKELFRQLTAHTYKPSPTTGKTVVSPKDEVRATLRRSPDKADAVAYGNWVRHREIARGGEEKPREVPVSRGVDLRFDKLIANHDRHERSREKDRKRMISRFKQRPS